LECAKELHIETGGTAPKGYRTETGDDPSLADFKLKESPYASYPPRTEKNVKDANVTLWFGNIGSPGYWCTWNAAKAQKRPFIVNPTDLRDLAEIHEVFNIAGNRKSTNPDVVRQVREAFATLKA
jgi:hypothetical protein